MHGRGRILIGFAAGALTASAVTLSGAALAGGSSSGVLHACAAKHGGALRLAASCQASEHKVVWNAAGPRGPRGRHGKPGADGADGAGPAYFSSQVSAQAVTSGTPQAITHLTLPPGYYLIVATATASTTQVSDNGSCQLSGGGLFDQASSFVFAAGRSATVSVTAVAHTSSVDDQVFLACDGQTAVTITQGLVTATAVTSLDDQTPTG